MPDLNQNSPSREQIEVRAYEIYLQRGSQDGQDIADWLTAERELMAPAQASLPEEVTEAAAPASRAKSTTDGRAAAAAV